MQEGERVCASNEEIFGALLSFPAANQTVKEKRVPGTGTGKKERKEKYRYVFFNMRARAGPNQTRGKNNSCKHSGVLCCV